MKLQFHVQYSFQDFNFDPILMIVWNALNEKMIPDVVVAAKIGALPYGINSPIDEP